MSPLNEFVVKLAGTDPMIWCDEARAVHMRLSLHGIDRPLYNG